MWPILLILAALLVLVYVMYNGLIKLRVLADSAWADIDVQLKRRHDLIPNLVETVKGYTTHERGTLEAVIEARNTAVAGSTASAGPASRGEAESVLTNAVRGLFALAESYPDLKASQNYIQLQTSLLDIEEDISNARRYYNAVVRDLNTRIQQFPGNFFAAMFGIRQQEFFEVGDAEREVPPVGF